MKRIPWLVLLLAALAGCATRPDPVAQDPAFDPAYPALSSEVVFESPRLAHVRFDLRGARAGVAPGGDPAPRPSGERTQPRPRPGAAPRRLDGALLPLPRRLGERRRLLLRPRARGRRRRGSPRARPGSRRVSARIQSGWRSSATAWAASRRSSPAPTWRPWAASSRSRGRTWASPARALPPPALAARLAAAFDAWSGPLRGTSGEALVAELAGSAARYDVVPRAPALAAKPVLLVAGTRDAETPPAQHHVPLAQALRAAGAERFDGGWSTPTTRSRIGAWSSPAMWSIG